MSHFRSSLLIAWTAGAALALVGCMNTPARIEGPSIDPQGASQAAIKEYDKNGDGVLSKQELEQCPALLSAIDAYDANKDESISTEEVAARLKSWERSRVGITSASFYLKLDGRPLSGAKVTLDPEPFLGGAVKPATGESNSTGLVGPTMAPEDLPEGVHFGLQAGLYKIHVSHPAIRSPAKYDEQTRLGIEVPPYFDLYSPPVMELKN